MLNIVYNTKVNEKENIMKIGILGTGDVGKALTAGFVELGYEVKIGTRDPNNDKAKSILKSFPVKVSIGTFFDAAAFGELIVIATHWSGTENAIKLADQYNFIRKVVIDATNPLDFSQGMPPKLAVGHTDSGGEQIQRWLPHSRVVKAFNTVGHAHMVHPQFPGGPPDMLICGNDTQAKKVVTDILKNFDWSTIDIGGIEGARLLEPMCILWVLYGIQNNSWNHAFKLLRK
jgi:8-hydroxy-5-deazaflavin:NADPH oxidoreductase